MKNRVLIICESHYRGQTEKIAQAMAAALRCAVVDTGQARQLDIGGYEVVGFGSGIFFGEHEPQLLAFTKSLHEPAEGQKAFLFSTRGNPMPHGYHKKMKELLGAKGWPLIGEFSCRGFDCTGPYNISRGGNKGRPNEADEHRAKKFVAKSLAPYVWRDPYALVTERRKIRQGEPNVYMVGVDGERIRLVGDTATVNHDACNGCGVCMSQCPCGVYGIKEGKSVPFSEKMCIQCRICEERCPQKAITIHSTFASAFSAAFQKR